MSKTTIAFVIILLMIATSGILLQKIVLEKRWAEDVIYFDIKSDLLVHSKTITTVHPTLRGWSWDRKSFIATNVSRKVVNFRSYEPGTDRSLDVEVTLDGKYIRHKIFFPDTKYFNYTYVSEYDLEYDQSMAYSERVGGFSWNWGSPEFKLPQRVHVTLPVGSELVQVNGVEHYETKIKNDRNVVFFENTTGPDEYFWWDVFYTIP